MRLLIMDDHKLFGESLSRALLDQEKIKVCDFVHDTPSLYQLIRDYEYDILLLDINLKDVSEENGFEILQHLKEMQPEQKVVILSSYDLPLYEKKSLVYGACDFITKSIEIEDLVNRLHSVYRGKKKVYKTELETLTERECEILLEICKGKIKKEIAKEFYLSERTLYNHIKNIYEKLGVSNTIEAYNKAIEIGYIEPLM